MFQMGKGFFSGLVGILFCCTKAQLMQLIWAPESMIVVVSMAFIVSGETMILVICTGNSFIEGYYELQ